MATKTDFTEQEWEGLRKGVTGSGMLVSLSDRDFTDTFGEAGALAKYLAGARDIAAEERVRVFRLAWDFAASALGSRNEQYERFYLASGARNMQLSHLLASRERAERLVNRFLREKA